LYHPLLFRSRKTIYNLDVEVTLHCLFMCKNVTLLLFLFSFFFIGCYDFDYYDFKKEETNNTVKENVKKIFGVNFDEYHDWVMRDGSTECMTFCFEDRVICDYDMNDVVIKARRVSATQVEYVIVACGSNDRLYVQNIAGSIINGRTELHDMFGVKERFINVRGIKVAQPIGEVVSVGEDFDFHNSDSQPYIYNETTGDVIFLSCAGEDPHAIMLPFDFKYPVEGICIGKAYPYFSQWMADRNSSNDWLMYYDTNFVCTATE